MELSGWQSGALQPAYDALVERWRTSKDRETGLRLLFLAWYTVAEPEELTGLGDPQSRIVAAGVFESLHRDLAEDPEFLLVGQYMISVCAWAFNGSEKEWEERGDACLDAAHRLGVPPLAPETFSGRGAYGAYFEETARALWAA